MYKKIWYQISYNSSHKTKPNQIHHIQIPSEDAANLYGSLFYEQLYTDKEWYSKY